MKKAEKSIIRKHRIGMASAIVLIIILSLLLGLGGRGAAARPEERELYYQMIQVKSGDNLWDLAIAYAPAYSDIRNYVSIIKQINHIRPGDLLIPGETLIIPYYQ